jgi:homoserine dehydrogenase
MRSKNRLVLKFGGSVIHSKADFESIANEIKRFISDDFQVVVVVSAYYNVTERLIAKASEAGIDVSSSAYAAFVSNGEFETAKDLTSYLVKNQIVTAFRSPAEFDFVATGSRHSASPRSINSKEINAALEQHAVIVMPGFSAVDEAGDSILLGRGGSDISAVFVAQALGLNSVRLLKDVDGIYNVDPNQFKHARRLEYVDYERACEIGSVLIQPEAIEFAATKNVCIDIAAIGNSFASRIGPKNLAPKSSLRAMQQLPNHNDQSIQDGSGSNSLNQIL